MRPESPRPARPGPARDIELAELVTCSCCSSLMLPVRLSARPARNIAKSEDPPPILLARAPSPRHRRSPQRSAQPHSHTHSHCRRSQDSRSLSPSPSRSQISSLAEPPAHHTPLFSKLFHCNPINRVLAIASQDPATKACAFSDLQQTSKINLLHIK